MYCDDYLSIGGKESTEILAEKAGITKESRVLDVGSGLGGPAFYLAKTYGCRVIGLDVTESNFREASRRAKARRLDHLVELKLGTALDMPFRTGTFDVVCGQDAWCHMTDKDRLIQECARVLAPGGMIAFTDWLQTGEMDEEYRSRLFSIASCPYMGFFAQPPEYVPRHIFMNSTYPRKGIFQGLSVKRASDSLSKNGHWICP